MMHLRFFFSGSLYRALVDFFDIELGFIFLCIPNIVGNQQSWALPAFFVRLGNGNRYFFAPFAFKYRPKPLNLFELLSVSAFSETKKAELHPCSRHRCREHLATPATHRRIGRRVSIFKFVQLGQTWVFGSFLVCPTWLHLRGGFCF